MKDISFELRRGECLGLIGHNGAGKSTLLKILNGLINPDAGKVTIKGRVGALIELGAGFNPILSGRENIYNNGAILGFTRKEIDSKVEEIIDFAEIREFIDMPVQNYSSGMKVRLGFAVAAQMEPDVLIIDEVLAVGDLGFVLKCFKQIDTILPKTAIVFVSHSMPMVSRICNQIILMDKGKAIFQGDEVGKAIDKYYTRFADNDASVVFDDGSLELIAMQMINATFNKAGLAEINWNSDLNLYIEFFVKKDEVYFSELSPRPHDTGMVTMFTQNFSEFDLHARAILDFTIPKIELCKRGVSQVILANKNAKGKFLIKGIENAFQDKTIDIRIFGKPETKPYRRMGVILASNLKKAKEALSKIKVVNV